MKLVIVFFLSYSIDICADLHVVKCTQTLIGYFEQESVPVLHRLVSILVILIMTIMIRDLNLNSQVL